MIFIAGNLTSDDWIAARDATQRVNTPESWQKLFDDYFQQRLDRRYFNPIRILRDNDTKLGEGFAITAIICTLLEFLAAHRAGKTYRHAQAETDRFYSKSGRLFAKFLCSEAPFNGVFDATSADTFYKDVRCGLLHEARTKGDWTIWADNPSGPFVDIKEKVVYRNNLLDAIKQYIARTRRELATDAKLQAAFVQTFDSLCQP